MDLEAANLRVVGADGQASGDGGSVRGRLAETRGGRERGSGNGGGGGETLGSVAPMCASGDGRIELVPVRLVASQVIQAVNYR